MSRTATNGRIQRAVAPTGAASGRRSSGAATALRSGGDAWVDMTACSCPPLLTRPRDEPVMRLDAPVAQNLEAVLIGIQAQLLHIHQLAIGKVHDVGEERVEQLGLGLHAWCRENRVATRLEKAPVHVQRQRLVRVGEVL